MMSRAPTAARALCGTLVCALLLPSMATAQDSTVDDREDLLSSPRTRHAATLLQGGDVLVSGGSNGEEALASVELIDPQVGTVTALGDLTTSRAGHTATPLADGLVLVAGGTAADGTDSALASAELYDPATGRSQPAGSMRWARAAHRAVPLDDGRVLLIGGVDDGKPVARSEIYVPATSTFEPTAKPKATHVGPAVTLLPDGRVLLSGAVTQKKSKPAEVFFPAKGKWATIKGAPQRSGHTATTLADGRVLLIGGLDGEAVSDEVLAFDPAKSKTKPVGELQEARIGHTAVMLPDGRVLVLGGLTEDIETSVVEVFDPATGESTVIDALFLPRTGHTATALPDGRALVVGGDFAGLALDDVLVFDPADDTLEQLGGPSSSETRPVVGADLETRDDVHAELGNPDAFTAYYFDEVSADGSIVPVTMGSWTYYGEGVEFLFEDEDVVSREPVRVAGGADVEPAPYDPDQFRAYMSLDEVVEAAGLEEYMGGPVDEAVEGGELFLGDRLVWGIKDGELRYVEALALETASAGSEDA